MDDKDSYDIYETMQAYGVFGEKKDNFNAKLFAFYLASLPGTPYYQKFLGKIRNYFDKEAVEGLINTYTQCIQQLNMDSKTQS